MGLTKGLELRNEIDHVVPHVALMIWREISKKAYSQ
jgi:hypothetical protein